MPRTFVQMFGSGGDFVSPTTGDPSFSSVVLLAGNDNAANGTGTFLDQSASHKTLAKTGTPAYSNIQAPTGMTTSIFFAGPDYIDAASSADFGYGTQNFTIEWMQYVGTLGTMIAVDQQTASADVAPVVFFVADGTITYFLANTNAIVSAAGAVIAATWQHVAVSKVSSSTKLFVAGAQVGSTYSDSNTYITSPLRLATRFDLSSPLIGYLSNIRVTKGVGRYSSNFTPPTLPFQTS